MAVKFLDDEPAAPAPSSGGGGVVFLDEAPSAPAAPGVKFLDDHPASQPEPEKIPDSGIAGSFAAAAAQGTLNTLAAPAELLSGPGNFSRVLSSEAYRPEDQPLLESLKKQYQEAESASNVVDKIPEDSDIGTYLALKRQKADKLLDQMLQLQKPRAKDTTAGFLREAAGEAYDAYGVDPRSTNTGAKIARGAGGFLPAVPAMMVSGPLAIAQMGGQAYEGAYKAKEDQLRNSGVTDEDAIEKAASGAGKAETLKQAPALALYMVGGSVAAGVGARLIGKEASVAAKTLAGFAGAAISNVAAGSVLRALEAEPGKRLEEALPSVENLTADTLFAVFHAAGEYGKASKEAQKRAKEELGRRGFEEKDLAKTAPPPADAPTPAQTVVLDQAKMDAAQEEMRAAMRAKADEVAEAGLPATAEALRKQAESATVLPTPPPEAEKAPETAAPAAEPATPAPAAPPAPGTAPQHPASLEIHRPEADLLARLRGQASAPVEIRIGTKESSPTLEPESPAEPPTETEATGLRTEEVPLKDLTLSSDVPQFKKGADEKGIVEPLEGKFDRTGVAPIQVWERLDGRREVISGRHRFDLANRSGEETIPAQVHREADGFNQRAAARLDAELNIRDGQGSVADYAQYFRESKVSEADARERGLLARAKGSSGFSIARGASEDVFALHQSGRLKDSQAAAIADAAPGNDAAQRLGTRAILAGATNADAANAMRAAVLSSKGETGTQGDFFSDTGLDEQWLKQGKIASQNQKALREQITAVQGAAKRPEQARKLGVDVKDPAGVQKRIDQLKGELARWENWPGHPDLVKITQDGEPKVSETPSNTPVSEGTQQREKPGAPDLRKAPAGDLLAGRADDPFNLVSETAAEKAARVKAEQAEADAKAEAQAAADRAESEKNQGSLFGSKTPQTPEAVLLDSILTAAEKAPTEAQLDAEGKQPTTVEFSRPSGAGKITVQNTREALLRLSDRYRAPSSDSHLQRVGEVVEKLKSTVKGLRIRLLRSEADLPDRIRVTLRPRDIHEGIVDVARGDVYLFANNIRSPERAAEVFLHEVVGHYGVEQVVKPTEWHGIANSIIETGGEQVNDIGRRYIGSIDFESMPPEQRALIAKEYIARLAERPAMNPPVWQQIVQAIRNTLRRMGVVREWSEADIADLIRRGKEAIAAPAESSSGIFKAVRDLGGEIKEHSPLAEEIEQAFESAIPTPERRGAVSEYVKARMAGEESTLPLSDADKATAEHLVSYFQDKQDFARRNGVDEQAQAAVDNRLAVNPSLSLPEQIAIYSAETNRAVNERAGRSTPPAPASRSGDPTSIKNATVDAERAKRGLPPAMEPARRAFGRAWDDAMATIATDSTAADRLITEIENSPRALTDTEDAILLHRQVELQNEYDRTAASLLRAGDLGDEARVQELGERRGYLADRLQQLYDATKSAGTATGRGLNARKMLANEDFTLAKMVTDKRVANGGKPLTEEQQKEVESQHAQIKRLQKMLDEHTAAKAEKEAAEAYETAFEKLRGDVEKENAEPPAKTKAKGGKTKTEKVLDALKAKADEARARIKAKQEASARGERLTATLDPTDIDDYAIIGAELLARGAVSIGRFTAKLVLEFGETIRPYIPKIYDEAKRKAAEAKSQRDLPKEKTSILEGIKARVEDGDSLADLPSFVRKLALNLVRGGVSEREPLIDAIHGELQKIQPDITRRRTMDLISGYGDFKPLDKETAKVTLRDLKGQMQQIGKLEDMASGKAPKKTGVEQRDPSAAESKLRQEVNEAKKRGGFEITDPATQLKSALQSRERALTNEIRAVQEEISTGSRRATPAAPPTNARIEQLRAELASLREQRDALIGSRGMTDEQRLKIAIESATRSAEEYERQVKESDFAGKAKKPAITSPELEAAKARRDQARAERDELKALDETVRRQKEAKRTQDLQDQIAEIDRKLREGDTDAKTPAPPLLTPEQEALVSERDAMLRHLEDIRRNPKPEAEKQVERLLKQVDELDRRLRDGDLDPIKPNPVQPLTPEAERLMAMRDAMRREIDNQRKLAKPRLSNEEIALKRWKSSTLRRIRELQERTAANDFTTPERMPVKLDKEGTDIAFDLEKAKEAFLRGKFEDMLRNRSTPMKILGTASEIINTARATMTAFDLSAVLRQGGFITLARPVRALRAFPSMFRAFGSERGEHAVMDEIQHRPNADLYRQAKLEISQPGTSLTKMEEAYMSRWAEETPIPKRVQEAFPRASAAVKRFNPVAASSRAYRTFLNRLRADSFDALVSSFSDGRTPTIKEAKALANFVNVATGRGALGPKMATAAVGLNHVLFAPRLVLSRFQLIAGQPLYGGTAATRVAIAKEYARYLVGVGVVTALASAAGAKKIETDPRSSSFGKIRFGDSRIDPWSGLVQASVILSRVATGKTKSASGNLTSLRVAPGEKRKFGQDDTAAVLWRFLRTKFSPVIGTGIDIASGTNVVGEAVTPAKSLGRMVIPLTFGEVYETMQAQGVPKGTAMALITLFGGAIQTYPDKPKKP